MMNVVLEIVERIDVRQNGFHDVLVVVQDFLQGIGRKMIPRLQVQKFAKRKSSQVVGFDDSVQFRIFVFQSHDGRTGKYNLELRILFITRTQIVTPVWKFKDLIDEQDFSSPFHKLSSEIYQTVFGK